MNQNNGEPSTQTSVGSSVAGEQLAGQGSDSGPGVNATLVRPEESMSRMVWRRFRRHKLAVASMIVLGSLIMICFTVPLFVSEEAANTVDLDAKLEPPSREHPFGTDSVGRDLFLRAIYGGKISLRIGILAALIAVSIGVVVGGISGFYGGITDNVLMRFTEALMSIPTLFILIVLGRVLGPSINITTVIIGVLAWMATARLVRAEILSLKEQDFVIAAGSIGAPSTRILVRHLLPNVVAIIVVSATLMVGQAIIMEAALSFLGLGVQPPTATWGNMLSRAQGYLRDAPWIAIFPGLLILISVLCVNFIGDGLRDAMDPHAIR